MSEQTNDQTNENANAPEQPTQAPAPATEVALSGVTATAEVGDLSAVATQAATGLPTSTPLEPDPTAAHDFTPDVAAALVELANIEQVALFWGGDRGAQLRNSVGRARIALTGRAD